MAVESGQYGNATFVTDADTGTCTTADTIPATGFAIVCHLTKWTLKRAVKKSNYASNVTRANQRVVTGGGTAEGSLETIMCMNATEMALIVPGMRIRLRLYVAPLLGHEFTAKIISCDEDVSIEDGKEVRRTFSYEQDDNLPTFNVSLAAAPALP